MRRDLRAGGQSCTAHVPKVGGVLERVQKRPRLVPVDVIPDPSSVNDLDRLLYTRSPPKSVRKDVRSAANMTERGQRDD